MCCGMAAVYFLLLLLPYISSFWGWYQEYWAGCHDDLSGRTLESEKHFVKALELTGLNLSDQRVRVTLQALDILYAGHRRFDRCQKIVLYCLQADEASADRVNLAKDSLGAGKLYRKMR